MSSKLIYRFICVLILLALLVPMSENPLSTSKAVAQSVDAPKLQGYLATLAQQAPGERVAIIVQKQGASDEAEQIVSRNGGQVTKALPMLNAFAAVVPVRLLTELEQSTAVRWVSLDAPVVSQNSSLPGGVTIQDDFAAVAYNGSTGSFAWQSDWVEIGEADGAEQGDVAVTTFWGGALQGLRLQGGGKGALRPVDLSQATSVQLALSYRRKSFISEGDYVALEVSTDAGATWTDVVRWAGPVTDDEMQNESYDLSAYRSAQTIVRFVTSPDLGQEARFYLDSVQLDFVPTENLIDASANKLYLPLVANADEEVILRQNEAGHLSKQEALAQLGDDARLLCLYQCIDRAKLASIYVKAIDADNLWNTWPYIRGEGVTVAVVDSGISPHPDFNGANGVSRVIKRVNFVSGSTSPDDFYGHGTHIAGTIAGSGQSSSGKYMGVAPEAKLVDVKVMDDWGYGNTSDVVAGLQWIYDNRATYNIKVVNLSLNSRVLESYHESALNAALEVLWFNKIVVVVSAGNGGKQHLYPPANDPFVITVGAADDKGTDGLSDDTQPTFSAYGMTGDGFLKPDIVAPGANIVAPLSGDDNNLAWAHPENKLPSPYTGYYYRMSGTSMASAVVAGAVALLLEDEPWLTPDMVKYRLKATALYFNGAESCATGAGYLDIENAVYGFTILPANTGIQASQLLWTGSNPVTWGSVSWNSVSWNSVSWNSVSWNSVSWNSVSWNSVSWNSLLSGLTNKSCGSSFKRVLLINANTGQVIQPLYDGAVINVDAIGTRNLSVRVDTVGSVESIKFDLSNSSYTKIDNSAPYALVGDNNGVYAPYTFNNGNYKLKLAAYSADNAGGTQGASAEMNFVVAGASRCELEGSVRSLESITPMRFGVRNNTGITLELFWLNYNGQRQSYGTVAPGASWEITSYVSHPWLIAREADDVCVQLIPDIGAEANVSVNAAFNGTYKVTAVHSGKVLDVSGASTADGATVHQWSDSGSANQKWRLELVSIGIYRLVALHSGKCLDVSGASTADGANVQQYSCHTGNNQRWRIEPADGGAFRLVSINSNKCLNVSGASTVDGGNVVQWPCAGAANEKWLITPIN